MVETITNVNNSINSFVWNYGLYLLLATGVVTTIITGVFQITHIRHWFAETLGSIFKKDVSLTTSNEYNTDTRSSEREDVVPVAQTDQRRQPKQ